MDKTLAHNWIASMFSFVSKKLLVSNSLFFRKLLFSCLISDRLKNHTEFEKPTWNTDAKFWFS